MPRRVGVTFAALLAIFAFAASSASAAPSAHDNTIMAANQWLAYEAPLFQPDREIVTVTGTCLAAPFADAQGTQSAKNPYDSTKILRLYAAETVDPNCATPLATLQPDEHVEAINAFQYSFTTT